MSIKKKLIPLPANLESEGTNNKVGYYCFLDEEKNIGVAKKINQTLQSIALLNYFVIPRIFKPGGIFPHLQMIRALLTDRCDIAVYRLYPESPTAIPLALVFLFIRWLGAKVIIEVPTPVSITLNESRSTTTSSARKFLSLFFTHLNIPFSLWPANRVVQYAPETGWFQLGLNDKTLLSANGIKVSEIPLRTSREIWNGQKLKIIAISTIADWQGFDRIIKGIHNYKKNQSNPEKLEIVFKIVGDGPACLELKKLAARLNLDDKVIFTGPLTGKDLDKAAEWAHIGIGTLAGFRKGLYYASPLKHREYAARGIPFLLGCEDPDFGVNIKFVHKVNNCEDPVDLHQVVEWCKDLASEKNINEAFRKYASEHLDLSAKVARYLDF